MNDDEDYSDDVYFTRLHIRYNRSSFPQDLQFQVTPNTENFQARYVITHPATGDFSCDAGKQYLKELKKRRQEELETLTYLTGKGYNDWDVVLNEQEKELPVDVRYATVALSHKQPKENKPLMAAIGILGLGSLIGWQVRRRNLQTP